MITYSAVLVIVVRTSDGEIARLLLLIHSTILRLEGFVDRDEDLRRLSMGTVMYSTSARVLCSDLDMVGHSTQWEGVRMGG